MLLIARGYSAGNYDHFRSQIRGPMFAYAAIRTQSISIVLIDRKMIQLQVTRSQRICIKPAMNAACSHKGERNFSICLFIQITQLGYVEMGSCNKRL
jgi:hypothetical protein